MNEDDDRELASSEEPKRVMCLMSDTGGGHRASAVALKDAFEALYGACVLITHTHIYVFVFFVTFTSPYAR